MAKPKEWDGTCCTNVLGVRTEILESFENFPNEIHITRFPTVCFKIPGHSPTQTLNISNLFYQDMENSFTSCIIRERGFAITAKTADCCDFLSALPSPFW